MKKQVREQEELETHLLRELAVLNYVRHENMLEYIGAYNEVDPQGATHAVYIVTELAAGGDLMSLLLSEHELGWKFVTKICHGAAAGLEYLHSHNLIHRDVKSSNILLSHEGDPKLGDLGVATLSSNSGENIRTFVGTPLWLAPEAISTGSYDAKVDVWALGVRAQKSCAAPTLRRAMHSTSTMPNEKTSTAKPYGSSKWSSGAIYSSVPHVDICSSSGAASRHSPKSAILHVQRASSSRFDDLTSRWIRL